MKRTLHKFSFCLIVFYCFQINGQTINYKKEATKDNSNFYKIVKQTRKQFLDKKLRSKGKISRKENKAFQPLARKVLSRDEHTCRYCGFQAQEYQEVVNLDRNPRNNALSNLATSCVFCSQCHFLESIGQDDTSGGQVVYLPEMSQQDLNSLCHVLFCAMSNKTGYADTAQEIYRTFR